MAERSVLKAAWLIAVVIIVSKFIGFLRDITIANCYGASLVSDAYFYAYQLPALALVLLGGVGGPFHSAVVSVFSKMIPSAETKAGEELNKLFNTFMTTTFFAFLALAVLCFVFSDAIMGLIISGNNPELISLAGMHLKIMSPILVIGGIVGIYYGVLVSYREFALPNMAPILMSLVIITMITLVHNDTTGKVLATATLIGALCQLVSQIPKVRKFGFRLKPNLDIKEEKFKQICELLFPAILSSTVGQLYVYIDMFFASSLAVGAWTAIGYSNRIFQFPVGILVTAFLVPLFPIFSTLVGKGELEQVKRYFNHGVGVLFFVGLPIMIGIFTVGYDAIKLIFQRGAFDERAVLMVTQALICLAFAILPYLFRDSITRIYYSFNDSKTPFMTALFCIGLKIFLNWLFVLQLKIGNGIGGITLSTSIVTLCNATLLGCLVSKKIKMNYGELFKNLGKMLFAAGVTLTACYGCGIWFDSVFAYLGSPWFEIAKILTIFVVCVVVYVPMNLTLKNEYAIELFERLFNKIRKKLNGGN
ncbi:murein biosynthesis integral membrane protein MurJ [bacterium]|nr:murein biosynthesis integral membrane protein MurJ [bacterium]